MSYVVHVTIRHLLATPERQSFVIVLEYIVNVLLALSICGCSFTILTFLMFSNLRTYPIKLILYLCTCTLVVQIFFYVTFNAGDSFFCIPCAMILHYFFLANFIWTFFVAFNFYQMIVRRNRNVRIEKIYHIVSWICPLIIVIALAGSKKYSNLGGYCYIGDRIAALLGFFAPGLIIVAANTVLFVVISHEIHNALALAGPREWWRELRVFSSIFISIGLSWIFGFIIVLIQRQGPQFTLLMLSALFVAIQGFMIFISYCMNKKVVYEWVALFGRARSFLLKLARPFTLNNPTKISANNSPSPNSSTEPIQIYATPSDIENSQISVGSSSTGA